MRLTVDTEAQTLEVDSRTIPLYSQEAFEALSREWVRVGWACQYYFTFKWAGRPVLQLPEDLVRLQEVIHDLQPDVIVETGIYSGGSLLFHATVSKARIIGIDINVSAETRAIESDRITIIQGDSAAAATINQVRSLIRPGDRVMVVLDSHHSREHVLGELEAYSALVTEGSCIIVTDGVMRDLADVPGGDPSWVTDNPLEAAREFLAKHPEFEQRAASAATTYWPEGWLWRR